MGVQRSAAQRQRKSEGRAALRPAMRCDGREAKGCEWCSGAQYIPGTAAGCCGGSHAPRAALSTCAFNRTIPA
jgi:hypothetical protein